MPNAALVEHNNSRCARRVIPLRESVWGAIGFAASKTEVDTLAALAEAEINATARNTHLWEARRLRAGQEGGR